MQKNKKKKNKKISDINNKKEDNFIDDKRNNDTNRLNKKSDNTPNMEKPYFYGTYQNSYSHKNDNIKSLLQYSSIMSDLLNKNKNKKTF